MLICIPTDYWSFCFLFFFYTDGRKLKNTRRKQETVLFRGVFLRSGAPLFLLQFWISQYFSVMQAATILYIRCVFFVFRNLTFFFFFDPLFYVCLKKEEDESDPVWLAQIRIHISIFMFDSNAIWSEPTFQMLTCLSLPWPQVGVPAVTRYCIKQAASRDGRLSVNILVHMMSSCFTHCGTSNLSSFFFILQKKKI